MNSHVQEVADESTIVRTQQPLKQPPRRKKAEQKKIRGVFEHPAGSGVWWINYYAEGKRHREKIGRRGDAIDKYRERKTDELRGVKLPQKIRVRKTVLFSELATDAMVYSKAHKLSHRGDLSNLNSLLPQFGTTSAEAITPTMIGEYLASRTDLKPASLNRYRSTMSMIYQEGIRNSKVKTNPARLVRLRKEDNARVRFLTLTEETLIRGIIRKRCPIHEADVIVALETGMRLTEQHQLTWDRVDLVRRQVQLLKTKNGAARTVELTDAALKALKACHKRRTPETTTDRVFLSKYGKHMNNPRAWFELVMADAVKRDAALAGVTWHVLRHTAISRAVMAGMSTSAVMAFAGHKSLAMTARYTHLAPQYKRDAVDMLTAYRASEEKKAKKAAKPPRRTIKRQAA